jgi:hypothetical protein
MPQSAMSKAIAWFKKQFGPQITAATKGTPFHLDFMTALALQETYEVWGRAYKRGKTPADTLQLCVGDILDATGGRDPKAFPQSRQVLEKAKDGPRMFKIARQALEDMAQVATEYKKYLKNKDKFCHAFGIFQYDIQAFKKDPDYFLNKEWGDLDKCIAKCLAELNAKWKKIYPKKKTLNDTELVYVAIAYNKGSANITKDFKQGYKGKKDSKYYGQYIDEYMRLSKKTKAAP